MVKGNGVAAAQNAVRTQRTWSDVSLAFSPIVVASAKSTHHTCDELYAVVDQ